MTHHFITRTSLKAFAFGIGATLAIALSVNHVQAQRDLRAQIKTLPTVVVNVKRVAQADIQRLPTVVITGRRTVTADGAQLAAAPRERDIRNG